MAYFIFTVIVVLWCVCYVADYVKHPKKRRRKIKKPNRWRRPPF